jgi:hypothetical protein
MVLRDNYENIMRRCKREPGKSNSTHIISIDLVEIKNHNDNAKTITILLSDEKSYYHNCESKMRSNVA